MTFITVRNVGAYGFNTTPLNGIGLSTAEAATTRSAVDQALALADALRDAMQAAREAGLQAFAPAQAVAAGLLVLPATLSTANRDDFFANVMGRAYAGGPANLDQWSQAVEELEHWAGATASMLPPGAGGGTRNVRGTWYVNGEPWSLSELFTVNRVNTLSEIDRMVADSLNVIAANNEAAKALTVLMQKLFKKHTDNDWVNFSKVNWQSVDFLAKYEPDALAYKEGNKAEQYFINFTKYATGPSEYPYDFTRLLAQADKHIGSDSLIRKLFSLGGDETAGLGKEDFRAMIDEVEQILGAFSADNQVAQLRNETLFNSRSNLLEGLGTFLKGQQTTRSTVARNA
jgi:hypothetical protein